MRVTRDGASLRDQVLTGAIGSFGVKLLNTALGLVVSVFLARLLSPAGYGVYIFALSILGLLSIPVQLGIPTLLVREVARYQFEAQWALVRGLLIRAHQAVLLLSLATIIAIVIYMYITKGLFDPLHTNIFYWVLLLLPVASLLRIREAALQGLRRTVTGQLPGQIIVPLFMLTLCAVTNFFYSLTPELAMALFCLATGFAVFISSYLLSTALPVQARDSLPEYKTKEWATAIPTLSLLSGFHVINGQADLFLLGLLASKEDVGLYRVALSGSALVIFLQTAINSVLSPHIAKLYVADEYTKLQRLATIAVRTTFLFSLPVAGTLIWFGEEIVRFVFGDGYVAAYPALLVLCLAHLINVMTGPASIVLNMTRNEKITLRTVSIGLAINLIANLVLIPKYGILGAAISAACSVSFVNIALSYYSFATTGIQTLIFFPCRLHAR